MKILISLLIFLTSQLYAKDVQIAIGLSLPPYFIEEQNSGMEYEVIKEALAVKGHVFKPKFFPFARVIKALEGKEVDGAATINESSGLKVFYSDVHMTYQNYAVTLKAKNHKIEKVSDLSGKSVASFQNATKYLGEEFAKMAADNKKYSEHPAQQTQNKLLFSDRTDVVVGDKNIFNYYTKMIEKEVNTKQDLTFHAIFPPTDYKVGFIDSKINNDFNEGLATIKKNGTYQKILDKYQK